MKIQDPRGAVDFDEQGYGPTLVLVPGSCSTGAAWKPVISALGNGFRCITTSLPGYGGTAERRSLTDLSIARVAEAVEAVVHQAASPVHLVGHSFGGLVATAVAVRRAVPLASLTVLEAPAVMLLEGRAQEADHYGAFRAMTDAYFAAFAAEAPEAVAHMIDFYGGPGTYSAWPERVRAYVRETTAVNIRDWRSAYGFPLNAEILSTITMPSLVVWGGNSHPAAARANALLARALNARSQSIAGAAHFMIATHADQVAARLASHVTSIGDRQRLAR